eukprot:g3227.t1
MASANVAVAVASMLGTAVAMLRARASPRRERAATARPLPEGVLQLAEGVMRLLRTRRAYPVPGMDASLHYVAPHVPKVAWTALGDAVRAREARSTGCVDGSRWISLRLDGCGFSRAVRQMRHARLLEPELVGGKGFSAIFADAMEASLRALLQHFRAARIGFTQSDEITLFIAPTSIVRGVRQPHDRNGRVTKTTTLAAGVATAAFVTRLAQHCAARTAAAAAAAAAAGAEAEAEVGAEAHTDAMARVLPHFDCRLAHGASWAEARAIAS